MNMFNTEENLLIAIHEGRTVIKDDDVHTLKMLLGRRLVTGVDGGEDDYFDVATTPTGREVLAEIFRRD
jgi:hypothetical protein